MKTKLLRKVRSEYSIRERVYSEYSSTISLYVNGEIYASYSIYNEDYPEPDRRYSPFIGKFNDRNKAINHCKHIIKELLRIKYPKLGKKVIAAEIIWP